MSQPASQARDHLCLALDTDDLGEAARWAAQVSPSFGWVKVGLQLFAAYGPRAVTSVAAYDQKVFLDLKFHDIPDTVASAVSEVAALGAALINVHASGGRKMVAQAVEAAHRVANEFRLPRRAEIIAVTILTSLGDDTLQEILGVPRNTTELALELAALADAAGAVGVVASPHEVQGIKARLGPSFLVITPGIRLEGDPPDDQRRMASPEEAIAWGSDMLVIGRSVTRFDVERRAKAVHDTVEQELARQRGDLGK